MNVYISEERKREMIGELLGLARAAEQRGDTDESHYLYDEAAQVDHDIYVEMLAAMAPAMLAEHAEQLHAQDQQRKETREVIQLLDQSFQAWAGGDKAAARRHADAAAEHNPDAFSVIMGGIRIGEIPNPQDDPNGWAAFVAAAS